MRRPYIEVNNTSSILREDDPISVFVYMLNAQHDDDVVEDNITLLKTLISKGHIVKSSIMWDNDHISKIYGLKVNDKGRIIYEKTPQSQDKGVRVGTKLSSLDLSSLRRAVRSTHGDNFDILDRYDRHR